MMTAMDALRHLVELKRIKRKIEDGTATGEQSRIYSATKEQAWIDAEAIVDRRARLLRRTKPRASSLGRRQTRRRRAK